MALFYEIDPARSLIRFDVSGRAISGEIISALARLTHDPRVKPGMNLLSDHSHLEELSSTETVLQVLPYLGELVDRLGPYRCAMVAPTDAKFALVNLAAVYVRKYPGVHIKAFRTRGEAESWLAEGRLDQD